jgi:hypothetical protein
MTNDSQDILSVLTQTTGTAWHLISPFEAYIAARGSPPLVIYIADSSDPAGRYYAPDNYLFMSLGEWVHLFNKLRNSLIRVLPSVQFDLNRVMPKVKLPPYPSGYGVVTGEAGLYGSITLRPLSSYDQLSLSQADLNTLAIRASQTLGSFTATFKIKYGYPSEHSFALSSYVAGDFWCVNCKLAGNQITASANPKSIKISYQDCQIEGELGYYFTGEIQPKPEHPVYSHFHFSNSSVISLSILSAAFIVLTVASGGADLIVAGISLGATAYAVS